MSKTKRLQTIDGESLMSLPLTPLNFVVDTLLSQGLHILAGSPKVGKSWLALWLAVTVATGEPVWNMITKQGTTLYLCLEDSVLRIQNRLFEIAEDAPSSVHFCTECALIGQGLEEQMETFLTAHPDTVLVIIDTLQMVRPARDATYANDYRDLSALKRIADAHGIAILLIHHLRKESADDVFNRISGTTAISGAVDSSFTLVEERRGSGRAKLSCIGRDIEYSGTNFNRPGWQHVMELMENGQVETLIVKDMSRLGREYLQVGQYTELIFPSYGVRFIAVNDGVDSLYESTNDFTPFRNLMNEFYAKDCSKKGRSVVRLKAETGARVSSRPRYGYMKDPADPKRHMVPDPETAPVVRYIFDLCVSGKGPAQIAKQLKKDKIPTPGYSYYQKHGVELTGVDITRPYNWSTNTVAGILEDETYLGHTINLKSTTLSFKNKKRIERPESEQLRFENTHEALVTQQTWEIVQDIRKHKRRRANMAEQNIFSGLIYCLDCGGTMVLHRAHTMDAVKNNFMCSTYKKKGKDVCSAHYIREQELNAILLDDIRRVTHFARQNELRFAEHIRKKQGKEAQQEIAVLQKKIDTMQKRQAELTKLFKRLYEDSVLGRIPDEQYRILSQEYTAEQKEIQEQLPTMEVRLQELKDSSSNIARFIENAKRYSKIPDLTAEILRIFIKRVEVGERAEKYSRTAPQEVRIYYRDIGLVDELPRSMVDSVAEEIPNEVA